MYGYYSCNQEGFNLCDDHDPFYGAPSSPSGPTMSDVVYEQMLYYEKQQVKDAEKSRHYYQRFQEVAKRNEGNHGRRLTRIGELVNVVLDDNVRRKVAQVKRMEDALLLTINNAVGLELQDPPKDNLIQKLIIHDFKNGTVQMRTQNKGKFGKLAIYKYGKFTTLFHLPIAFVYRHFFFLSNYNEGGCDGEKVGKSCFVVTELLTTFLWHLRIWRAGGNQVDPAKMDESPTRSPQSIFFVVFFHLFPFFISVVFRKLDSDSTSGHVCFGDDVRTTHHATPYFWMSSFDIAFNAEFPLRETVSTG
ncbi:hypothetical protein LXL04_019796 [Taraxacum kok-saghyz]